MGTQGVAVQLKITQSNHVLPICYQLPFTNADGEIVVRYFAKGKPPISLAPKVVGVMNNFYTRTVNGVDDDGIEKFFNTFIEADYAPVARRIKEQKDEFILEKDDVAFLLKFVATQIVRTEAHRLCVNEQAGMEVPSPVFFHNMYRKMRKLAERWMNHVPDIILETPLPFVGSQFITGDNPVICFVERSGAIATASDFRAITNIDEILANPVSGFIVPLSPYVSLTIQNGGTGQMTRSPWRKDPSWVAQVNQRIRAQCVQFIAAMDETHLAGF